MQWYELKPGDARLLIIVLRRFMSPIRITVGKFVPLSLEYYAIVRIVYKLSLTSESLQFSFKNVHFFIAV